MIPVPLVGKRLGDGLGMVRDIVAVGIGTRLGVPVGNGEAADEPVVAKGVMLGVELDTTGTVGGT